jgi:hypothetical protein
MAHHILQFESELQNVPEAAPETSLEKKTCISSRPWSRRCDRRGLMMILQ